MNNIAAGRDDRPYFNKKLECECLICNCHCDVIYMRHEATRLAKQTQIERELMTDSTKQTKIDAFLTLKSDICKHIEKRYKEQNDGDMDNAMSMASVDILKSTDLNEDYEFQKNLREKIGNLTTVVNNKSVAELRRENREKRKISPHKALAHLPVDDSLAVVSPPPTKKTNRFYNNKLCTPVNDGNRSYSIISTPESSVGGKSTMDTPAIGEMKQKLIRRITALSSPVTEKKKKCYNSLVSGDEAAMAIVDMAVENGNSVEDTKNMLMNFI